MNEEVEILSMSGLQAGGISIHDGRTWHGSGENRSRTRCRRGIGIHFIPANVRFTKDAVKSRLWKPYLEGVEHLEDDKVIAEIQVPEEDFPIVFKPSLQ